MRYVCLTALAIFASFDTAATEPVPTPTPATPVEQAQTQTQTQSATQSQSASPTATATAGSSTSNANVSVKDRLQAPGSFVGAASPSAPCYIVNGWNVGVPGAGGGRSKSRLDEDCVTRERARLLIDAGYPELAARILLGEDVGPEALTPTVRSLPEPVCEARVERATAACGK